jgi:hypothetical protein
MDYYVELSLNLPYMAPSKLNSTKLAPLVSNSWLRPRLGCYGNFIPANQVSGAAVHWHNEWGGRHWMQDCMWIFVCTIIVFTV